MSVIVRWCARAVRHDDALHPLNQLQLRGQRATSPPFTIDSVFVFLFRSEEQHGMCTYTQLSFLRLLYNSGYRSHIFAGKDLDMEHRGYPVYPSTPCHPRQYQPRQEACLSRRVPRQAQRQQPPSALYFHIYRRIMQAASHASRLPSRGLHL